MSRRSEQLKKGIPTINDPKVTVPQEAVEQAKKIREALKAGKELCHDCMRIFASAHGLKVHQYHCKGQ